MSRLTAKTLRQAHALVSNIHKLGGPVPEGLALLERDYNSWRRRVQRGRQPETLSSVPVEPERAAVVGAMWRGLEDAWAVLEANGWRL